jgi:hypothetical protein
VEKNHRPAGDGMLNDKELRRKRGGGVHNYRAFLLRCWWEEEAGPAGRSEWHFTVIHFDDQQVKKGFTCLEALMAYLRAELDNGCMS